MPDRYLAHAREAEKLASDAGSESERRVHLEVAALWHELAKRKSARVSSAASETEAGAALPADIQIAIDEGRRRLSISVIGDIDGQVVADRVGGLFLAEPRVTQMDMVYDLSRLTSGVGAAQMDSIAAAYRASNTERSMPFRTAIVAPDPFYQRWADPLSRQFGREHRAFATLEDAEPFLSEPLADRA